MTQALLQIYCLVQQWIFFKSANIKFLKVINEYRVA